MKNRKLTARLHPSESVGVEKQKQKKGFSRPQVAPVARDFYYINGFYVF